MTATPEVTREGVVTGPPGPARKNVMDRFIDSIEWIAAFFVGIVALNTFTAVVMRKFFAVTIPDYYNFGQFLLGILIFWGIAATSYRGTHITVDLVWANATPKYQRWIDVFATLVLLFVVTVQTYTLFDKVVEHARRAHRHHGSAGADLAVLPGVVDRRRLGGAADRGPHLSADLPSRRYPRCQNQDGGVGRR